ncbi:beta-1,6-N-acetylglucosaminyltransferase [Chitinophaga sp. sic0106]|uniref:beta-1,6-N-acetylglucosaminyltransferase n=1 Tax=Chitinophaga sp. sic0106 TaxID=2854785 RepID=UPI001C447668|nr:beta-1,6-N-acetylglucosaminyltransferase [Chitinophaga sp. sic0106]MBV7531995.1 beta-1,6-N-acetylglucosaminyltransferase [Chitinophaga sp. sic0106]
MRLAFLILAHKNPEQLHQLLSRLSHPLVDCYVHLDAKADIQDYWPCTQLSQVYFIPSRVKVNWAGFSMVRATMNLMEVALHSRRRYVNISLLSGLDYPLRPIQEIFDFFTIHHGKEFMDIMPEQEVQATISKLDQYHFEDFHFKGKYFMARWVNRLMPVRKRPMGFRHWGGSQWWSLSEECARYCLQFINTHPAILSYYKYTWGPDEFIFHTIVMNSPEWRNKVTYDNLRYIDWSEKKPSPKTFTATDLPNLLASGKLFARKFDMAVTPEILQQADGLMQQTV